MRPSPPPACWRRAGRSTSTACTAPIHPASFPGSARASPSCGGAPIRAWCCSPASSSCTGRCARRWRASSPIQRFELRIDSAFDEVIRACSRQPAAGPDRHLDRARRWSRAYEAFHRAGFAHSVEAWVDGHLAGGLYCVAIGQAVFGESMFTRVPDASKIALAALAAFCRHHGIALIDCQQNTAAPGLARRARNRAGRFCGASGTERKQTIAGLAVRPRILERTSAARSPQRDAPQGSPATDSAVLRDGALPVQLPAGQAGALAGGHAQPPDPQRRLLRPGDQRLPAQRHVHLPAVLRRLPCLRAFARAERAVQARPQPAPRLGPPRGPAGPRAQAVLRAGALPPVPALPDRPPCRRRHGSRQHRPVHPVPAAKPGQLAAGGVPRNAARRHRRARLAWCPSSTC